MVTQVARKRQRHSWDALGRGIIRPCGELGWTWGPWLGPKAFPIPVPRGLCSSGVVAALWAVCQRLHVAPRYTAQPPPSFAATLTPFCF